MKYTTIFAAAIVAMAAMGAPAHAAFIPDGTLSISILTTPNVTLGAASGTYAINNGLTFATDGTDAFALGTGLTGQLNGSIAFSNAVGTTTASNVADFLTFSAPIGTQYRFSADSAITRTYAVSPSTSSISLYLLGTTIDTLGVYQATPTSLTLSFNKTGASAYSSSATLSIPPETAVPEAATWAMFLGGFGMIGGGLRRRKTTVNFQTV